MIFITKEKHIRLYHASMNKSFLRPSLVEGGIVEGFETRVDINHVMALQIQIRNKIDTFIEHIRNAILTQGEPLLAIFRVGLFKFTTDLQLEGLENIPGGKTVVVCNHPFPFVDDFALMLSVVNLHRERPWAFVGNPHSISHYFPGWRDNPSFTRHIIPVERVGDNSFAEVTNGPNVVASAIQFLNGHQDSMLFIAADGSASIFQDRIAQPYSGFAKIANSSGACVVPVLFTGKADVEKLTFEVRGKIFPGIQEKMPIPEMINRWGVILQHELEERKRI